MRGSTVRANVSNSTCPTGRHGKSGRPLRLRVSWTRQDVMKKRRTGPSRSIRLGFTKLYARKENARASASRPLSFGIAYASMIRRASAAANRRQDAASSSRAASMPYRASAARNQLPSCASQFFAKTSRALKRPPRSSSSNAGGAAARAAPSGFLKVAKRSWWASETPISASPRLARKPRAQSRVTGPSGCTAPSAAWTRDAKSNPSREKSASTSTPPGRTTRTISRRTDAPSARWWRTLNEMAEAKFPSGKGRAAPSAGVKCTRDSSPVPSVREAATSWSSAFTSTLSTSRLRRAISRAMTPIPDPRSRTGPPRGLAPSRTRAAARPPSCPRAANASLRLKKDSLRRESSPALSVTRPSASSFQASPSPSEGSSPSRRRRERAPLTSGLRGGGRRTSGGGSRRGGRPKATRRRRSSSDPGVDGRRCFHLGWPGFRGLAERLREVGDQVAHVLAAHGETDEVVGNSGGLALVPGHPRVRHGGGVLDERLDASEAHGERREPHGVDERLARHERERLLEDGGGEGVVDDEERAVRVRDVRARRDVRQLHRRVRGRLDVDHLRRRPHRGRDVLQLRRVDPRRGDAEAPVLVLEDEAGRAVDGVGPDDVRALLEERDVHGVDRGHAGRGAERTAATLERREALLERRDGRVPEARILVAGVPPLEARRALVRVAERERGGLVDRRRDRTRGGIGVLPRVDDPGGRMHSANLGHCVSFPFASVGAAKLSGGRLAGGAREWRRPCRGPRARRPRRRSNRSSGASDRRSSRRSACRLCAGPRGRSRGGSRGACSRSPACRPPRRGSRRRTPRSGTVASGF